jgi:hypothetical protein
MERSCFSDESVRQFLAEETVALPARFPEAAVDEILDLIRSTMIRIVS